MQDASDTVLSVDDLRVRLRSRSGLVTIVDGVSYSVRQSEAVALVGESGAGKSVSVRAVLGLLDSQRFEVTGRIRLCGVDLSDLSARAARNHVTSVASLVFQDPARALNPTMRVGWQIAEPMYRASIRGGRLSKERARARSIQLMRDVGIADPEERFSSYPHQLSGGMKQRIVIAIALSRNPRIIICDEPTSALDVTTQAVIMDLIDELRRRFGVAVVLITHDLALACSNVEKVMVMHGGRLVESLPASRLADGAAMPYTLALLRSMPDADGITLPQPISAIPVQAGDASAGCRFRPFCELAQDVCGTQVPPLEQVEPDHLCRCWFPVGVGSTRRG